MASAWTSYVRRFRYFPAPLMFLLVILICYLILKSGPAGTVSSGRSWRAERLQQIVQQFDDKEIDVHFIRQAGVVDRKIENLSEKDILNMNMTQLVVAVHSFLDNVDTLCRRQIRMGYVDEGGWEVCDDDGVRPRSPGCLVYAFGGDYTEHDFAFEEDIARVYNCEVHAFREDMEEEDYNMTEKISVHPYTVGRVSEITADGKERYTFEDVLTILDHSDTVIDVLKLDIQGGEWPVMHSMLANDELENVKQLLVECHSGYPPEEDRLRRELRLFKELSEAGFRKFNVIKQSRGAFHHPYFPVAIGRNYEIHYINTRFLKPRQDRRSKPKNKN